MTDAVTKSKTGETGTSNAYESFLKIPVDGTIKEVTIDALTRTLKNQGISAEADVLKSIRTKAELQIAHKQKDILDTKDSGNHAPTINRLVKLDQDVIDALTELIAEVDKHIKAKEANTRIEKLKAELLEEAQELKEQLGNEFNFQQFVNELANGLNITHNAPNSNTSGEAINGNPQTTLVSPTSSTYSDTQTHALNQTPPTLEEKIETGIHINADNTREESDLPIDLRKQIVLNLDVVNTTLKKNYTEQDIDILVDCMSMSKPGGLRYFSAWLLCPRNKKLSSPKALFDEMVGISKHAPSKPNTPNPSESIQLTTNTLDHHQHTDHQPPHSESASDSIVLPEVLMSKFKISINDLKKARQDKKYSLFNSDFATRLSKKTSLTSVDIADVVIPTLLAYEFPNKQESAQKALNSLRKFLN